MLSYYIMSRPLNETVHFFFNQSDIEIVMFKQNVTRNDGRTRDIR